MQVICTVFSHTERELWYRDSRQQNTWILGHYVKGSWIFIGVLRFLIQISAICQHQTARRLLLLLNYLIKFSSTSPSFIKLIISPFNCTSANYIYICHDLHCLRIFLPHIFPNAFKNAPYPFFRLQTRLLVVWQMVFFSSRDTHITSFSLSLYLYVGDPIFCLVAILRGS